MRPKLKLNNITTLHDARYCSAVGVDLLAFALGQDINNALSTTRVADIMEWLSGPESIGEFTYENPDEIRKLAEEAKVNFISIPADYPIRTARELPSNLVFRLGKDLDPDSLILLGQLAESFPGALFEFSGANGSVWKSLKSNDLIGRSLLYFTSPDPIYAILIKGFCNPYAFSLGDFVEEPDGQLDYETCDEFIEGFQALVTV